MLMLIEALGVAKCQGLISAVTLSGLCSLGWDTGWNPYMIALNIRTVPRTRLRRPD